MKIEEVSFEDADNVTGGKKPKIQNREMKLEINDHKKLICNGLGDCLITEIKWGNSGANLLFIIENTNGESIRMAFNWVTKLCIDFDFGGYSGEPVIFSCEFKDKSPNILLNFGGQPEGYIKFDFDILDVTSV